MILSTPAFAATAQVQTFPARPVRIMVGFSAATTSDLLARLLAQRLTDKLGVPVIVENREGAGGSIAAGLVARAAPDGHTLLLGSSALTLAPRLFRDVSFRPMEDFDPVGMIGFAPNVLVAGPNVPIASMAELLAAARAAPGRLRYASSGPGSGSWIGMEMLKSMALIDLEEVPYSSTAQAATDLLSGQIELHFPSLAAALPNIRAGRFRPLGLTSTERSMSVPEIPAIAETVPGYGASTWFGVVAPARLPDAVALRLNAELQAVLAEAPMQRRLRDAGVDPQPGTAEALRATMREAETSGNALMDRIGFRPR